MKERNAPSLLEEHRAAAADPCPAASFFAQPVGLGARRLPERGSEEGRNVGRGGGPAEHSMRSRGSGWLT